MLTETQLQCPYCGESQAVVVDCSSEGQSYYEDCQVCCRPMAISATCSYEGELISVVAVTESEATGF